MEFDEKVKVFIQKEIEKAKHLWRDEIEDDVGKAFHHIIEKEDDEKAQDKLQSAVEQLKKHLKENR